jgi:hypothetical protein
LGFGFHPVGCGGSAVFGLAAPPEHLFPKFGIERVVSPIRILELAFGAAIGWAPEISFPAMAVPKL